MTWITKYTINGQEVGFKDLVNDHRIIKLNELYPLYQKHVLELAPLEAAHSLTMHEMGASVIGVEGRQDNVDKCNLIKELFNLNKCQFILGDVRSFDFSSLGHFDLCLASGIFYHLDNPSAVIKTISNVADNIYIWTHVASETYPPTKEELCVDGYNGKAGPEFGMEDPESGLTDYSQWLYPEELIRCVSNNGWRVHMIDQGTLDNDRSWVLMFGEHNRM